MIYGYARVSTKGQARDGNSLQAQIDVLKEHGAEKIFADSFTGTKISRPQLDKLLSTIKAGDTLIVTKLDRVARSAVQGIEFIENLLSKGVIVNVLNIGIMDDSPSGKLMRTVFFAFAEFERDMIVQRTKEGKAIAREKPGYKEGRKKLNIPEFSAYEKRVRSGELTVTQAAKELGISRRTWYNLKAV